MGTLERVATWLGLRSEAPATSTPPALLPSERVVWELTDRRAMAVPAVFRAFQVLTTSAQQLSLDVRRGATPIGRVPSIIRRPSTAIRQDEWLAQLVLDMAVDGNAYARIVRGPAGEVLDLPLMPANEVGVSRDKRRGVLYRHAGEDIPAVDVMHVYLIKRANWLKGISPLEAARRGLTLSGGAAEYAGGWFNGNGHPTGILSSDQALTRAQADEYRDIWNNLDAEGNPLTDKRNPTGVKVLGKGLEFSPIMLKPADVLWLEAQDWTLTDVARLYGIPSTLMLVGVDGAANTYQNVAQEWLAFVRFTLMAYLRPVEQALTDLVARGLEVRFNLETLLRVDTKSRYEAHEIALRNQWVTVDEVRAIEGLGPMPTTAPAIAAPEESNV